MTYYALGALITFITTIFLIFFVLSINIKEKTYQAYALANLSVAFWSLFYFLCQTTSDYKAAFFNVQLLMDGAAFMPVFLLHFILSYLNRQKENVLILISTYLAGVSFVFAIHNNILFDRLSSKYGFPLWPDAGLGMPLFLLFFFIIIAYAMYLMFEALQNSSGDLKTKNLSLFIALLIAILAGSPNYPLR